MFRHEALLYDGSDGFLAGTLPYIRAGHRRGRADPRGGRRGQDRSLRGALGADADRVEFADMAVARPQPGADHPRVARVRGRASRRRSEASASRSGPAASATELVECQLHEALLNVAFADRPTSGCCARTTPSRSTASVIHEACCSHPLVDGEPSRAFRDAERLLAPFDSPLPPPPATARILGFELDTLVEVRRLVEHSARRAGLPADARAGPRARRRRAGREQHPPRRRARDPAHLAHRRRARVRDPRPRPHRRPARRPGQARPSSSSTGRGLWIANAVCDLVQIRSARTAPPSALT